MPADEIQRMLDVHTITRRRDATPLVWVRFNPGAFSVDGKRALVARQDRFAALHALLQQLQASTQPFPAMSVHYMFYDVLMRADGSLRLKQPARRRTKRRVVR